MQEIIEKIKQGKNLLITGGAGVGKSYTVNKLIDWCAENDKIITVSALTGMASLQFEYGTTLHKALALGINKNVDDLRKVVYSRSYTHNAKWELLNTDILVIDEVSMLRSDTLELCDEILKYTFKNDLPFGGLQVVFSGDFCLKNGTNIMMANGRLKKIEDINVGEYVMGPDSNPRKVLRRFCGKSNLYKISQTNASDYYATENHVLHLKRRGNSGRYPSVGCFKTIKVKDFNSTCSSKFKEVFGGHKAGLIKFKEKKLRLPPYFVGMWLGDGEKCSSRICSADSEILDYCKKLAFELNLKFSTRKESAKGKAKRISLSRTNNKNPIIEALKYYEIFNNKHIPEEYLFNSEKNRLELLAGLIDTDGNLKHGRFTFCSANKNLSEQVKLLCDQLGFRTGLYKQGGNSWIVSINGSIERIPTKIKRKIAKKKKNKRDYLSSTLKVSHDSFGDFSGIEVDGDNLFLLHDGTVLHNCQLPPVLKPQEKQFFQLRGAWCFQSSVWDKLELDIIHLTEIKRQDNPKFAKALNFLRAGVVDNYLNDYFQNTINNKFPEDVDPVRLLSTNREVEKVNNIHLSKLDGKLEIYDAKINAANEYLEKQIRKDCIAMESLELKIGAQVMVIKNDKDGQYVNGSMGEYLGMHENGEMRVRIFSSDMVVMIAKHEWSIKKKKDGVEQKLASFVQYPIKLGWAITIHKSQGMSLDYLEVDLNNCFAEGMAYVALSRARSYEGLIVKNWNPSTVKCNKDAFDFYMNLKNNGVI